MTKNSYFIANYLQKNFNILVILKSSINGQKYAFAPFVPQILKNKFFVLQKEVFL